MFGADVALFEWNFLGFEEHFHQFAGEAAGLSEKQYADGRHLLHQFNLRSDLRSLLQHGRDRTIFFFREADGVFHSFAGNFTSNAIDEVDLRVYGGVARRALAARGHF